MTCWGEPSSSLWMRMGRERGLPFLSMPMMSVKNKSQEKNSSDSSSRYADDHAGNVYRFINVQTKKIILSRDVQWLNSFWNQYKTRNNDSKNLVEECFLNDEDDQNLEERDTEENKVSGDGNNTMEQKTLGIDIDMIGARKEELGRTRSQTREMMSPRNESMERAELTMEDWIQETCLISAVASGPTEPKTFQEAWHSPVEEEKENWRIAIRKEIRSMINRGVWRIIDRVKIPENRRLIGNKWVSKSKEMEHTEQD